MQMPYKGFQGYLKNIQFHLTNVSMKSLSNFRPMSTGSRLSTGWGRLFNILPMFKWQVNSMVLHQRFRMESKNEHLWPAIQSTNTIFSSTIQLRLSYTETMANLETTNMASLDLAYVDLANLETFDKVNNCFNNNDTCLYNIDRYTNSYTCCTY